MSKIVNINKSDYEVVIFASNYDTLQKWAEICNCVSIDKISFIRYVVSFTTNDDLNSFIAGALANC